jgi:hypothetical protein
MFAESTNRGPNGKIGARFWLSLGAVWFVKNRRPNGKNRGPILRAVIFQKRIFWARFGTILWEFLLL